MSKDFVNRSYLKEKYIPLQHDMELLLASETEKISDYDVNRTRNTIISMCKAIINELE